MHLRRLTEQRLRAYENKHAEYMQTSVFTKKGKVVKAEMKRLESDYLLTREAWQLYEKWEKAMAANDPKASEYEKQLVVLVSKHKILLDN